MNDNFGINNKIDLYKRVVPALNSKIKELEKNNIVGIRKEEIWNYLIKYKWSDAVGLTLFEMVEEILNIDNNTLANNIYAIRNNDLSKIIE